MYSSYPRKNSNELHGILKVPKRTQCDYSHRKTKNTYGFEKQTVENVQQKSQKFEMQKTVVPVDEMNMTADQTNLDITLNFNETTRLNDSSIFQPDFTQIDGEVDAVQNEEVFEIDNTGHGVNLQKQVSLYLERRALNNRRRLYPDSYVPFEFLWDNKGVPQLLSLSDALRGVVHLNNLLQECSSELFSSYLRFLNINHHSCVQCDLKFDNPYAMLCHFCSVIHVNRLYSNSSFNCGSISIIDVYCVQKMISDVMSLEDSVHVHHASVATDRQPFFFDLVDASTAIISLESTVVLMQGAPLLEPPVDKADICEYVEALLMFRSLVGDYRDHFTSFRSRQLEMNNVHCSFCGQNFNSKSLHLLLQHLFSKKHVENCLRLGVSRTDMEFWLSFFGAITNIRQRKEFDSERDKINTNSLQQCNFPLCDKTERFATGDFAYQGAELEPVLNFIRSEIRKNYPLTDDCSYYTTCDWCNVSLYSSNDVLHHVLYDKNHMSHHPKILNDDLRRLLRILQINVTMPLFKPSSCGRLQPPISKNLVSSSVYRLQTWANKALNRGMVKKIASRSFPFGLVNRCDLCHENIEQIEDIMVHFCSEKHAMNVINNPRITKADIDCCSQIFSYVNQPFIK